MRLVKTDLLLPTGLFFSLLAIFPACLIVLAWGLDLVQGCSVVRGVSSSLSLPVSVRTSVAEVWFSLVFKRKIQTPDWTLSPVRPKIRTLNLHPVWGP